MTAPANGPADEPRLKIGESPKPVLWHVLAALACLLLMPLLSWAVEGGDDAHPRVFVSIGMAVVLASLVRWHYAHRGDDRAGELQYYRTALAVMVFTGAFGWMFSTSVLALLLLGVTFADSSEPDKHRPLSKF